MKRLFLVLILIASVAHGEGWLKQSTAAIIKLGPFVDSGDGVTAETGLAIAQADIQISKAGAAFAQTSEASPTTTHDADGWYPVPLTTTDTGTLGRIVVQVQIAGAVPVWWEGMVVPSVVYDSLVGGTDYLQADAVQIEGGDATDAINDEADTALSDLGLIDSDDLVDDILDELLSGHTTAGSLGKYIADILEDTGTTLDDLLDTEIAAILEDTGTTLPGTLSTISGYVDTEVADILADTNELQTDDYPTTLSSIAGYIDTEVADILADTNELQTDDYPTLIAALPTDADVNAQADQALSDYDPPTATELAAVQTHGDLAWATATGFSTHSAADVWSAAGRELSTPADYKADVSGLSTFDPAMDGVNVDSIDNGAVTADAIATNAIDADAIAADAIGASELAADAVTEIDNAWNAALTELATDPGATPTPRQVLALIYMANRNRVDTTSDTLTYYNDAGEAVFAIALSDDGTTFTRAEMADAE